MFLLTHWQVCDHFQISKNLTRGRSPSEKFDVLWTFLAERLNMTLRLCVNTFCLYLKPLEVFNGFPFISKVDSQIQSLGCLTKRKLHYGPRLVSTPILLSHYVETFANFIPSKILSSLLGYAFSLVFSPLSNLLHVWPSNDPRPHNFFSLAQCESHF